MTTAGALDASSGQADIMAEIVRLCERAGDSEASRFYAWSEKGLWRVHDRSEPGPMDIGTGRDDMQAALELDIPAYVRLRARRSAIGGMGEPDWSLAIGRATRGLLAYVGVDPLMPQDDVNTPCGWRDGMRVDSVTHSRGCMLSCVHMGESGSGEVEFSSYESGDEVRIRGFSLPATVLAGVRGQSLSTVIPHPVLDPLDLEILGGELRPSWDGSSADTIIHVAQQWEPLVPTHVLPRPWIIPLPLPSYV